MMKSTTSFLIGACSRRRYPAGFSRNLQSASSKSFETIMGSPKESALRSIGRTPRCQSGVLARYLSSSSSNTTSLSKVLASSTNYSRRELERLIQGGDVTIKGKVVDRPRISAEEVKEIQKGGVTVKIKGKPVVMVKKEDETAVPKVWAVNKLFGEVVGENDPQGRPSMMDRLKRGGVGKKEGAHLKAVGRLDIPTEGLILVTDSGKFARELELPKNQIHRVYRVRVHGALTENKLMRIRNGFAGFQPMKVEVERRHKNTRSSTNTWVQITATEGQNRQIRRVFQSLGMSVTRLIRIAYGDYQLHSIPPGLAIPVPWKPVAKQKRKGRLFSKPKKKRSPPKDQQQSSVRWMKGFQQS